jgi:hypothetical protein
MKEYYKRIGENPFEVLPQTYLVQSFQDPEFVKFEREFNKIVG